MNTFAFFSFLAALYPVVFLVLVVLVVIWVQKYLSLRKEQNDLLRELIQKLDQKK